jgi:5'-3' exonuclease
MPQPIRQHIKDTYVPPEETIYTLLIDGNNLFKIAITGDKRINSRNEHIGGIYQFFLQIKIMLQKKDFDHVYVMWDEDNSGRLRYDIYPEYKANRDKNYGDYNEGINNFIKKTLLYSKNKTKSKLKDPKDEENFIRERLAIKEYLEELFIRQISVDKVEGDDLIAYYCLNKKDNEKIVIMSGDKDLSQLISDTIVIWDLNKKKFITKENHINELGYHYENILLKKIFCGDASDNIKGVKGLGETLFFKYFPKVIKEKVDIDYIINEAKTINENRILDKKKPIKVLDNIVNRITDGCQGDKLYEINEKIINLKMPLMTEESIEEMKRIIDAPIDPENRSLGNLYKYIIRDDITELKDDNQFVNLFNTFNKLIDKEKKYFYKNMT